MKRAEIAPIGKRRAAAAQESGERIYSTLQPAGGPEPARRSGGLPRTSKRMRNRTPKRAAEEHAYAKARVTFLELHPFCHCGQPATEVHHMAGREGWRLLYEPCWLQLCRGCHQWATEFPAAAVAAGYSRTRHGETT